MYHDEFSLQAVSYLENFGRNFREISAGMKFEVVLLVMSANCIAFGKEENLVEIVTSVKQFFHSGCVYLLQYHEAGKYYLFFPLYMIVCVIWSYYFRENGIETYLRVGVKDTDC